MRYVVKFHKLDANGLPLYVAWDTDKNQIVLNTIDLNQDKVRLNVSRLNRRLPIVPSLLTTSSNTYFRWTPIS